MLRGKFVQGGGIDYAESSKKYEADFREVGFGSIDEPADKVAERINRSAVRVALIEALDDWAACAEADMRAWILQVAKLCDPDPWRDEVRSQEKWASLEHLQHLSEIVEVQKQPVTLMVAMGTRWRRLGGDPTAYLRRVHREFPNDFWLNFELAVLLGDSDTVAAFAYNRAALAIRPDAEAVHFNLGINLSSFGKYEEAGITSRASLNSTLVIRGRNCNSVTVYSTSANMRIRLRTFKELSNSIPRYFTLEMHFAWRWLNLGDWTMLQESGKSS